MDDDQSTYVVIGASGGIGSAVTRLLAAQGKSVRAVNRSGKMTAPEEAELYAADAMDPAAMRQACEGAAVVFNCVHPAPNEEYDRFVTMSSNIIDGAADSGAKLVLAASVYPYGKVDRPMTEDMPQRPVEPTGVLHAKGVDMAMEANAQGRMRTAVGRSSNYYGPNAGRSYAGDLIFQNALNDEAALVIGNMKMPHTYTYVDDFATGLITLADNDEALGGIWHVPAAETITTGQFIDMVYTETGNETKMRVGTRLPLTFMSLYNSKMKAALQVLYQFDRPFIVDHSKYEKAFGANPTSHADATRLTLDWYRQKAPAS